jgi:4-hydroxy-2-oxoheptanedioate aldolase
LKPNTVKRILQAGKPAVGVWINWPSPVAAEALASVGWDWLVVDTEHGAIDLESMQAMFIAIGATPTIPMCRVPWNDPVHIKRALDAGSLGIVVPMVCTPEEATQAVRAAKYPPEGIRSSGGGRWRYYAGADYTEKANDEIAVIVMIEHVDAVKNAEAILSVKGVDACFIGPNDLSWSMDVPFGRARGTPEHQALIAEVLRAAQKVGVPAGIHCSGPEEVNRRIDQGFQFLACTNDAGFMMKAATEAFSLVRNHREAKGLLP